MKKPVFAAICLLLAVSMLLAAAPVSLAADACASGKAGAFAGQPACLSPEGALHLCEKNFPDGAFRTYLADSFDKNGDGALSEAEASAVTAISCPGQGIGDLTGVGFFAGLISLDCSGNCLKKLSLSANRQLTTLKCGGNSLAVLDLTKNTALTSTSLSPQMVECEYNAAKQSIDVSAMLAPWTSDCIIAFGAFYADGSEKTVNEQGGRAPVPQDGAIYLEYTVNANYPDEAKVVPMTVRVYAYTDGTFAAQPARTAAGRLLICEKNFPDAALRRYLRTLAAKDGYTLTEKELAVESLVFSRYGVEDPTGLGFFTAVRSLDCSGNRLSSLPAGLLKGLSSLNCANNRLTALDLSGSGALRSLDCSGNRLAALDLSANRALESSSVTLGGQALATLGFTDANGAYSLALAPVVGEARLRSVSSVKASTASGADAGARYDSASGTVSFTQRPAALTYSFYTAASVSGIPEMTVTAPLEQGEADCVKGSFNGREGYVLNGKLHLCEKNFPDAAFLTKAKSFDADGDGLLSAGEAEKVTSLVFSAEGALTSLRGVEFLPALKQLSVTDNRLTELDLSNNRELTALNCAGNRLNFLDLSANVQLPADNVTAGRQTGKALTVTAADGRYTVDLSACVGAAHAAKIVSVSDKNQATAAYDAKTGRAVFSSAPASPVTYTLDVGLKTGTVTMNVVCEASVSGGNTPGPAVPGTDPVGHTHKPYYVPEKAACKAEGWAAHYECACGKWFTDEKGEQEVSPDSLKRSGPIGHRPSGTYSASALYHWFACVNPGCGEMMPDTKGKHQDANGDGKCDTCASDAMSRGILGDVDADGVLAPSDARLALRAAVGLEKNMTPGSVAYVTADADNNGTVAPEDARLILRAAINLEKLSDYVK